MQNTQTLEVLKKLVAYPSVTPQECGVYAFICGILPEFKVLEFHKNGVKNVFLYRDFREANKLESKNTKSSHLCFAGHIDVVPPGEGWESEPFTPLEKDGFLYGRGTQKYEERSGGVCVCIKRIFRF